MRSSFTVIIPVHNDSANLAICYQALANSSLQPDEVIVVDDGSQEPLPAPPSSLPVLELRLANGPQGSFVARNRGAEHATGEILVFVDADVRLHRESLERMTNYLKEHPSISAAFGSYDDAPAAQYWVSRYKNLMHHYVHQNSKRSAGSFWTGFGAMRQSAFEAVGGFSTDARTVRDIDMGMRLRRAGMQIHLCPEMQVTHLKRWTLRSMIRSDIVDRATPWTRLIAHGGTLPDDLNLAISSRLSAFLTWLGLVSVAASFVSWPALLICLICWGSAAYINRDLWRFMADHGGILFCLGAMGLHGLYLLYSSATFAVVYIQERARSL